MLSGYGDARAERGSGPVTVVLVLGICALLFVIGVVAVGAMAREERSAAQHAADAAALAGAQRILDDLPGLLVDGFAVVTSLPELAGAGPCGQRGQVRAAELATANGATLTSYCWNVLTDRVTVTVRLNHAAEGEPATAEAEAETRFALARCTISADFVTPTPTPTPSPTPTPTATGPSPTPTGPPPPPPPPPPVETSMDCGFGALELIFDPGTLRFTFVDLDLALADVRPRLTG